MNQKYLDMADAALETIYKTAPDIFSDVWCLLGEDDSFKTMRLEVAQAIKDVDDLEEAK